MRSLIYTQTARSGMFSIADYIAKEVSLERSFRYLYELEEVLEHLCTLPESCPLIDPLFDATLRRKVFQKHTIILYTFDSNTVYIEAVLDARSNWLDSFLK
jgi:plasmid stabilization system protein ParE